MFQSKRFKALFTTVGVMPWMVAVFGAAAAVFYDRAGSRFAEGLEQEYRQAEQLCDLFYHCAMGYGAGVSILLLIAGLTSFGLMLVRLFGAKKEEHCVARPLILFLWSGACVFETLFLMLLTIGFTYGQGV